MALLEKIFGPSWVKGSSSFQRLDFQPDLSKPCDNSQGELPTSPLTLATVPQLLLCTMRHNASQDPAKLDTKTTFCNEGFLDRLAPDAAKAVPLESVFWDPGNGAERAGKEAAYGHQGLASYIYTCWAQEKGAVLRPDMIWATVCAEFARAVEADPKPFGALFTSQNGKQTLLIPTASEDGLPLDTLMTVLDSVIPSKELKAAVTGHHFATAPPGYTEAMAACFASAATPYYNYVTYRCGIPYFCIVGDEAEWRTLAGKCSELAGIVSGEFSGYLNKVAKLVSDLTSVAFADLTKPSNRIDAETFFSACFWITAACGSGHPYYCQGWLQYLYYSAVTRTPDPSDFPDPRFHNIANFPTHMGLVPWKNLESNRKFCSSTGLLYSVLSADGKFLLPCYGQLKYEITDEALFNKLAKK